MRWVAERCGRRGVPLVCGMMAVVGICLGRLSASDRKSGFTEHLLAGNLGYVFGVAAADLDGDGDLDITSPDIQDKSVSTLYLFRNNGKGKFQKQVIFAGEPGWFERHVIGDIDGDNEPDFVGGPACTECPANWYAPGQGNGVCMMCEAIQKVSHILRWLPPL